MSEVKHTPGEWTVLDHAGVFVVAEGLTVADVTYQLPDREGKTQRLANARLIAAAPDLLQALKALGDHICNHLSSDYPAGIDVNDQPFMKARAAIAKATGEQA